MFIDNIRIENDFKKLNEILNKERKVQINNDS